MNYRIQGYSPADTSRKMTTLYQGGVGNLTKVFFIDELKEVGVTEDGVKEINQCEFLFEQCYEDHTKL